MAWISAMALLSLEHTLMNLWLLGQLIITEQCEMARGKQPRCKAPDLPSAFLVVLCFSLSAPAASAASD